MEAIKICNVTNIGNWQDVKGIKASELTKRDADKEILDGLIVSGYEMKFGVVNENGEKYEKAAFDDFIEKYFVGNKLNIPVDLMHGIAFDDLVGRVIYAEVNTTGLYFTSYIPRTEKRFEEIKHKLEEGILQGFSKSGYATDYEYKYTKDGDFDHLLIREFALLSVSLVATPANSMKFEFAKETANATAFENKCKKKQDKKKSIFK